MKKNARILSLLLSVVMIFGLMTVPAAAADEKTATVTITAPEGDLAVGSTVEMAVTLTTNPGFFEFEGEISLSENLTFNSIKYLNDEGARYNTDISYIVNEEGLSSRFSLETATGADYTGSNVLLFYVVCTVNAAGEATVSLTDSESLMVDFDDNDITVVVVPATATVAATAPEEGGEQGGNGDGNQDTDTPAEPEVCQIKEVVVSETEEASDELKAAVTAEGYKFYNVDLIAHNAEDDTTGGNTTGGNTTGGNTTGGNTTGGNTTGGNTTGGNTTGGNTTGGNTTGGNTTGGNTTGGNTTGGNTTGGNTTGGNTTGGNTTGGNTTGGNTTGGGTTGDGTNGNTDTGDGTNGNTDTGDGTNGNTDTGDGTNGNTDTGDGTNGNTDTNVPTDSNTDINALADSTTGTGEDTNESDTSEDEHAACVKTEATDAEKDAYLEANEGKITVVLPIPEDTTDADYTYSVVYINADGEVVVIEEKDLTIDEEAGTITFTLDGFYTIALCWEKVVVDEPEDEPKDEPKDEPEDEKFGFIDYTLYSLKTRTVVIEAIAGEGGSITNEGKTTVAHLGSITYTIEADEGYKIASIKVDGKFVPVTDTYTFKSVVKNQKIEVTFAEVK